MKMLRLLGSSHLCILSCRTCLPPLCPPPPRGQAAGAALCRLQSRCGVLCKPLGFCDSSVSSFCRGVQLKNPFYSIWTTEVGTELAVSFDPVQAQHTLLVAEGGGLALWVLLPDSCSHRRRFSSWLARAGHCRVPWWTMKP